MYHGIKIENFKSLPDKNSRLPIVQIITKHWQKLPDEMRKSNDSKIKTSKFTTSCWKTYM